MLSGCRLRIGLHTDECELVDEEATDLAVPIGARIAEASLGCSLAVYRAERAVRARVFLLSAR
jgi:hypothetical protein